MSIQVTDRAAAHIRRSVAGRDDAVGLRLGVRTSGCSGFMYTVDYADAVGEDDTVFDVGDVRVVVDRKSLPFIEGMEVDFVREGLNERFAFRNPNATAECGCGESFSVA
ncbi:Iron-binding protein IscA [wastewater metagenome]|uniref:Iron-binding protein IscA n=3 Tax=root TaxID=1 RepID=A0A5B8RC73_9ZZZZ|nr:iron-sulfur cluster assembly accessory protein [Arhodomonas aquaeolei]MCS4503831.1 iron-sulfur cluster assembly accessory protein [Arhodomonas aquaeolei]QEA05693.1 iron-binding protein IscA [uncultured organism]